MLFPSPTATALTIRSMHAAGTGAKQAMSKLKALGIAFSAALVQRVASYYAVGILYDWHVFTWIHIWSGYTSWALNIENWGWFIEWTPAFIGSGMLIGLNSAISMFVGSFLAWGVIGPTLVHYGECIGIDLVTQDQVESGDITQEFYDKWNGSVSFISLSKLGKRKPSPRYWLLWPGVMIMVCCALAELLIQYKIIWFALKTVGRSGCRGLNGFLAKRGKSSAFLEKRSAVLENENVVADPARDEDQVKPWMWILGLVVAIVIAIVIGEVQWGVNGGLIILALILAFLFAFLCIQIGAVTDQTPLTA